MIDGGPLRTSRPTGRQTTYRNESVRYQPEEPQHVEPAAPMEAPRHVPVEYQADPVPSRAPRRVSSTAWMKWVAVVAALGLIVAAGWMLLPTNSRAVASTIDTDKYQAVFLSNGQVYFGKLSVVDAEYMRLTNVYYLERQLTAGDTADEESDNKTTPTSSDNNFQLLKYSDVLYGSEDAMIISKDDIIRYENLRSDGVVAKAIANRR